MTHDPRSARVGGAAPAKPLLRALAGRAGERVPVWLMRQAGRYLPEYQAVRRKAGDFLDLCFTPELAAEVTLQPVCRFGMDGAILFSDILVIPHALGQPVAFRQGEGPVLEPVTDAAGVARLSAEAVAERLAPVFETVRRVSAALPGEVTLLGFAGAPWTVATYMVEGGSSRDFAAVKSWALREPESFRRLVELLVESTAAYLIGQIRAGAEAVQLFDTWAGALPEPMVRAWVMAPTRAIVERLRAFDPAVPVIGFPRGLGPLYPDYVRETGVDAVGIDTALPPGWAAREIQPLCPVQGNLDPRVLVVGGAPLREAARGILAALSAGPFVFNLGHGVVPETPPEHVAALVDEVRAWPG